MKRFLLIIACFLICSSSFSQTTSLVTKHYNLANNLAIQGYDPVAYFSLNKAVKGDKKTQTTHLGAIYYFSSEKNKSEFLKNPTKYEPQYGGWCAYAMGVNGKKVEIDPKTFKLIDGKLYLFYNSHSNNTLITWNKDEDNLKKKADKYWLQIFK